jgi:hypothetical protein
MACHVPTKEPEILPEDGQDNNFTETALIDGIPDRAERVRNDNMPKTPGRSGTCLGEKIEDRSDSQLGTTDTIK